MENLNTSIWTDEDEDVGKARISPLVFATCLAACETEYPDGPYGTSNALDELCVSC